MTIDPHSSRDPSKPDPSAPAAVFRRALADRFELVGELDYGRLGTVYEAVDRTRPVGAVDSRVALLRIPLLAGREPARIQRDFARLLSLRHPNIVRVFELLREADAYLVTMEFVDGRPLRTVLDNLRPELPSRDEAFDVLRAVGAALIHAHARGVVHGDVDVANVLIGGASEAKLPFAACLLRRGPSAARERDDTRGLARIAYEMLAGAEPSGGRIRGLRRAEQRALRAALYARDHRGPDLGELVAAFAPPAEIHTFPAGPPRGAPRAAWAAVLVVAILGLGYVLHRDDVPHGEPIVDAEVSPLADGGAIDDATDDAINDEIDDEPAIDDDDPEAKPASG